MALTKGKVSSWYQRWSQSTLSEYRDDYSQTLLFVKWERKKTTIDIQVAKVLRLLHAGCKLQRFVKELMAAHIWARMTTTEVIFFGFVGAQLGLCPSTRFEKVVQWTSSGLTEWVNERKSLRSEHLSAKMICKGQDNTRDSCWTKRTTGLQLLLLPRFYSSTQGTQMCRPYWRRNE